MHSARMSFSGRNVVSTRIPEQEIPPRQTPAAASRHEDSKKSLEIRNDVSDELKTIADEFDENHDGQLDASELKHLIKAMKNERLHARLFKTLVIVQAISTFILIAAVCGVSWATAICEHGSLLSITCNPNMINSLSRYAGLQGFK